MRLTNSISAALASGPPAVSRRLRAGRRRAASIAIHCSGGARFLANASASLLCGQLVRALSEHQISASFESRPRRDGDNVRGILLLGEPGGSSAAGGMAYSGRAGAVMATSGIPVVGLNVPAAPGISTVCVDYGRQGERVVEHLYERGHRRIAIVLGREDNWATTERRKGFVAAMTRRNLPLVAEGVASTVHQPTYGLLNRLVTGWKPTAAFLACEEVTIESVSILREMAGGHIPRELSLVGLETPHVSRFHSPPLTTIAEPTEQVAELAVRMLVRQIQSRMDEPEHVVLESNLIERASVRTVISES